MEPIALRELIGQLSLGLDAVEGELMGAAPFHSKRVALYSLAMGRFLGYDEERLFCLAGCALLHDNALTEYILSEQPNRQQELNLKTHCMIGQVNAEYFPFPRSIDGFILYHHECADGSGAFGKRTAEYPEEAEIIALADRVDVRFGLGRVSEETAENVKDYIRSETGGKYTRRVSAAAIWVLRDGLFEEMSDQLVARSLEAEFPEVALELSNQDIVRLSGITAKIIDYKSRFTREHTTQIANKAWHICGIYGYQEEERCAVYLAAALHDLGKLFIPSEILEKPGKLTEEEFRVIQSHVQYTWDILHSISGFEKIAVWAADHHEKLDGSGYPYGKTGDQLDFNSRLLACLDIYQAVREARPYHPGRSHEETMKILYDMAGYGKIDPNIVRDLDRGLAVLEEGYAPPPEL